MTLIGVTWLMYYLIIGLEMRKLDTILLSKFSSINSGLSSVDIRPKIGVINSRNSIISICVEPMCW